jgi:hypothetical protein
MVKLPPPKSTFTPFDSATTSMTTPLAFLAVGSGHAYTHCPTCLKSCIFAGDIRRLYWL